MDHIEVDVGLIATRFESTVAYLTRLYELQAREDWATEYAKYRSSGLSNERALALVHPRHLQDDPERDLILGKRQFNERTSAAWCRCQASMVWGYECPLEADSFEADHLFPFQAGGPTSADNRIWLCRLHNRVKSSDVHLFPWELSLPAWVDGRLQVMAARLLDGPKI